MRSVPLRCYQRRTFHTLQLKLKLKLIKLYITILNLLTKRENGVKSGVKLFPILDVIPDVEELMAEDNIHEVHLTDAEE